MRDSQRYRYKAADCLRAAQLAHGHPAIHLSMALAWLSLAHQDEATVSNASRTPTISRISQSQSVRPAAIAGVTRSAA
jgi:hypothetical protein